MTAHNIGLRPQSATVKDDYEYKSSRALAPGAVMDKAKGEQRHQQTNGFIAGTFRRDERDRRACRPVPMPGDPPADLEARRALAEAGNPQVARKRILNV